MTASLGLTNRKQTKRGRQLRRMQCMTGWGETREQDQTIEAWRGSVRQVQYNSSMIIKSNVTQLTCTGEGGWGNNPGI